MNYFNHLLILITLISNHALAVPSAINFQANIRKPDTSRLESPDVSYRFKYMNAASNCTVYVEDFNNVSMVGSAGNISLKMGTGTKVFPASPVTLFQTFDNDTSGVLDCAEGGTYSPLVSDERRNLTVEFFYPGSGGTQALNGIEINSVPYALHANDAEDAQKLGGFAAALFTKFSDFTTCTGGQVLTYDGTAFSCVSPGAAATFTGVLAGDVSGTQSATVVDTVGGKTAAQISTSVDDTLAATNAATVSTIVKRDASGNAAFSTAQANNFSGRNLLLFEPTNTNHVLVKAPTTFTGGDYVLTLPESDGTPGQVLSTDGNGVTTWIPASTGSVTNVSAGAPLLSSGGATPNITMPAATASVDGYLSAADFTIFSSKQTAGAYITALTGDVTAAGPGSAAATIANNAITTAKINNLAVTDAKINDVAFGKITGRPTTVAGYGITDAVTNVTTGAPLVSSGGTTPNITMPAATASVDGYLSATDFTTFNNKVSSQWTNNITDIYFNTGNVGIGTTTPATTLDVNGVISANAIASTTYVFKAPGDTDGGMTSTADGVVQFLANGAERMRITPGAIGIGTTTPAAALDVNGGVLANSVQATTYSFKAPGDTDGGMTSTADGVVQFTTNSVERMRLDGSGNLGLGTTTPAYKLDVVGDVNVTGNFKINGVNIASGTVTSVAATAPILSSGGATPTISMPAATGAVDGYLSAANFTIFNNKQTAGAYITALTGDVTAAGPGSAAATIANNAITTAKINNLAVTDAKINDVAFGKITGRPTTVAGYGITDAVTNVTASAPLVSSGGTTPNITMPAATAAVDGYLSAANFTTFNNKVSSQWTNNSSDIYFNTGRVGIGTNNPYVPLQVVGTDQAPGSNNDGNIYIQTSNAQGANIGGSIGFGGLDGGGSDRVFATAAGRKENGTSANYAGYFAIETRPNGGSLAEGLRVTSIGRVGVGLTNPQYKLDVNGDINISAGSNFKINGANVGLGTVTGTGTTNRISKFTAAGAIGDSNISDNGTVVAVTTDATVNGVAIGRGLASLSSNTVVGSLALSTNTTGSDNSAFGTYALRNNTTGNANIANGFMSLYTNTTGYANTAVGSQTLQYNTTGYSNTAIGDHSMVVSTTGSFNTAVGSSSLAANTTGDFNTTLGYSTLSSTTTGFNNTGVGHQALRQNTTGNYNTALGSTALTNVTTGAVNTAIGNGAGSMITTGSYNVVLGTNNGSTIATTNNNIIISDGQGNIRQQIDSAGLVGIGMTPATYRLSVNGDINIPAGSNFKINGTNVGTGTVTGTGTINTVPKFTAAGAIGNSNITDNGTVVAVSTDATINGIIVGRGNSSVASNVVVGPSALSANTTGSSNIAVGQQALNSNTTGDSNTSVGHQSLLLNTSGGYNVAMGMNSLRSNTTGVYNTATGTQALNNNSTGTWNTAVGGAALQANTTGGNNTAIGGMALTSNTTGNNNMAAGYGALSANTSGVGNTASGYYALNGNSTGTNNVANGYYSLYTNTTGNYNTAVGVIAMRNNTTGNDNTAIGYQSLYTNSTGGSNVALGSYALQLNTTGTGNVAAGHSTLNANTTGTHNVGLGHNSLVSNTTGNYNTAAGAFSLLTNTTGNNNTAYGYFALYANTTGGSNVSMGHNSLRYNSTGTLNVGLGTQSLFTNTTGSGNVSVGNQTMLYNTTGGFNTAVGTQALSTNTTGYSNVAIGGNSLQLSTTGVLNTAVGAQALQANTTGSNNVATGMNALVSNTTGIGNVATGYYALGANTTADYNTAVGNEALRYNSTGVGNVAVGHQAFSQNTSGNHGTAMGYSAMGNSTVGVGNVAFGYYSLYNNSTKSESTAIGYHSMYNADDAIAAPVVTYNTAIGAYSLYGGIMPSSNTGVRNTALGHTSLRNMTSGSGNIGVGYNAGSAITTGSNNVVIGSNTGSTIATASNNILIADGAGSIRIQVDSAGQVGMGVAPTQALDVVGNIKASGCVYYSGGSVGVCASDERLKDNVHAFDLGLETLMGINPVNFKYNGKAGLKFNNDEQLGVIAQDLEKSAPSLVKRQMVQMNPSDLEKTEIKVVDYGAFTYVMINAIKDLYHKWFDDSRVLHREIASVKQENVQLKNENEQIKKENEKIKERLDKIEHLLMSK